MLFLMMSITRLPENNGSEACDSMLLFGYILGRKGVK